MKVMKSKDIHFAVKKDDGINYLMDRFGFQQKEELFEAIKRVTPSGAEDLIRELKKKEKTIQRRGKNNSGADVTVTQEIYQDEHPVQEPDEDTDSIGNVDVAVDTVEKTEEKMQKLPDIEQLKKQEQELSTMCRELEGKHKEFVTKRRAITANVQKAQNALKELRRLLGEQERIATELSEEYLQCAAEMEAINQERRTCEALLEEVRIQISDLNKVTILVYQNGTIEVENGEIPSVSDEEVTAVLVKLVSMPQVGKITVDELKAIAKLLKMVNVYETSKTPFELEFDSTDVQRLWQTVTTA